jgi:hypothetical protein
MSSERQQPSVAFAWYDEAQWLCLTGVVPDRSELDDTYEQWEHSALKAMRALEARGYMAERIFVDVQALCKWCQERNLPVNGAARSEYVATLLRQKQRAGA